MSFLEDFKRNKPALSKELAAVFAKHGITFQSMGGSFGHADATIKIKVIKAGTDPAADRFKQYADLFGMDPNWLGKQFRASGQVYTITGLNDRSRSSKRVCVTSDRKPGVTLVATAEQVIAFMKSQEVRA